MSDDDKQARGPSAEQELADQDVDGCHHVLTAAGISAGSLIERVEDLIDEREAAEAEISRMHAATDADRAAVRALVEALPRCEACGATALWLKPEAPDMETGRRGGSSRPQCDAHKGENCARGCCAPIEVAGAAALRALLARVAGWGTAAAAEEPGR